MQVVLESNSSISEVEDDLPQFHISFNTIERIQMLEKDSQCGIYFYYIYLSFDYSKLVFKDYLGVFCKDWGKETTSNEKIKRDLSFTDKSKDTVITRWIYIFFRCYSIFMHR